MEKPDGWTANFGDFIRFCEERGYDYEDDIEADIAFKEFLITELRECVIKDMPYQKAMQVIEDIEEELRVALNECHDWNFVKWVEWLKEKYAEHPTNPVEDYIKSELQDIGEDGEELNMIMDDFMMDL